MLLRSTGSHALYVVENLEPQTNYEFRFAASNEAGRGVWGMNKRFSTTMRNVPGPVHFLPAPEGAYITSHYHDKYNAKWSVAPDNGEIIDYYEVKWCRVKKYTDDQWEQLENTCLIKTETKRETWLSELYPDTYYKIELRAHNKLGLGLPANITIKTTRGKFLSLYDYFLTTSPSLSHTYDLFEILLLSHYFVHQCTQVLFFLLICVSIYIYIYIYIYIHARTYTHVYVYTLYVSLLFFYLYSYFTYFLLLFFFLIFLNIHSYDVKITLKQN
jgi:hypothetical protein